MTFNPHIENLSQKRLLDDFRFVLKKYYRKVLGRRYFKYIDKQYDISIFEETGKKFFEKYDSKTKLYQYFEDKTQLKKEPHLHIIVDVPTNDMELFCNVLRENLENKYPSLTTRAGLILTDNDEKNAWNYCSKEGGKIFSKTDLTEKSATDIFTDSTSCPNKWTTYP